jgi:hypothetical protein
MKHSLGTIFVHFTSLFGQHIGYTDYFGSLNLFRSHKLATITQQRRYSFPRSPAMGKPPACFLGQNESLTPAIKERRLI